MSNINTCQNALSSRKCRELKSEPTIFLSEIFEQNWNRPLSNKIQKPIIWLKRVKVIIIKNTSKATSLNGGMYLVSFFLQRSPVAFNKSLSREYSHVQEFSVNARTSNCSVICYCKWEWGVWHLSDNSLFVWLVIISRLIASLF